MMAAAERFLQLHQLCDRTSTPYRTRVFEDGSNRANVNSSNTRLAAFGSILRRRRNMPILRAHIEKTSLTWSVQVRLLLKWMPRCLRWSTCDTVTPPIEIDGDKTRTCLLLTVKCWLFQHSTAFPKLLSNGVGCVEPPVLPAESHQLIEKGANSKLVGKRIANQNKAQTLRRRISFYMHELYC